MLPDLFSRRKRQRDADPKGSDPLIYDAFSDRVRVQLVHVWSGYFEELDRATGGHASETWWAVVRDALRKDLEFFFFLTAPVSQIPRQSVSSISYVNPILIESWM